MFYEYLSISVSKAQYWNASICVMKRVLTYYSGIIAERDVFHESNNFLKLCDVCIDNKNWMSKKAIFYFVNNLNVQPSIVPSASCVDY